MAHSWWHSLLPCLLLFMASESLPRATCPLPCMCSPKRVQCQRFPDSRTRVAQEDRYAAQMILTSVPQRLPDNGTVTSLTINHMRIPHVTVSDFSRLLLLQKLDLTMNRIDTIDDRTFQNLASLESLMIADNFLQGLSKDVFVGLARLKRLDVSRNRLLELVARGFLPLKNLEFLNLADNEIEHIQDEAFYGLFRLQTLILTGNRLMVVSGEHFKPVYSLEKLMLDNCSIVVIEFHTFSPLGRLTYLSLDNNTKLKFLLAEAFVSGSQTMLEVLSLRHTGIQEVPVAALKTLPRLKTLDLSETQIPVIRNHSFIYVAKLVNLTLDALPRLHKVEQDAFSGLRSLQYLTITNNRLLNNISNGSFRNLSSLRYLDLSNNSLETFSQGLAEWQNLYMLDLRGNPLRCDCSASWMLTALRTPPKIAVLKNTDKSRVEHNCDKFSAAPKSQDQIHLTLETLTKQVACHSPSRFEGRCLLSLSAEKLCSNPTATSRLPVGVLVVAVCCVLLLLCAVVYKFRRRICNACRGSYGYQMHRFRTDSRQSSLVDVLEMEAT